MRSFVLCVSAAAMLSWTVTANGAATVFTTNSSATQTINSPLFGGSVSLSSAGPQVFTINPATGVAGVTSDFTGSDLPDPLHPGEFLTYQLYNTVTQGIVKQNNSGSYDITFELLFELKITSGILSGLTFQTLQYATFATADVTTIPFPPGTAFSDPAPPDTVVVYLKIARGQKLRLPLGTSTNRVVTVDEIVP